LGSVLFASSEIPLAVLVIAKLMLAQQVFVLNSYTRFHENLFTILVTDSTLQPDGWM
jgi:hypothetical protein